MRQFLFPIIAAVMLTACTPLKIYHKPGVSIQRWQADTTQCQIHALRQAPVKNVVHRIPPEYIPQRRSCDSSGNCTTSGGYWIPGEIYTVDENRPLRKMIEKECMNVRGYTRVEIEQCPQSVKVTGRTKVLPPINEKSCAIKNEDGSFLILNRE